MRSLLDFLSRNKKLVHLDISGNFTGKSGCEEAVKMVKLLMESKCPLGVACDSRREGGGSS